MLIDTKGILWDWEKSAGEYREYGASFGVSTNSMSFLGYLEQMQTLNDLCSLKRHPRFGFDVESKISTDQLDVTIDGFIKEYESTIFAHPEDPHAILRSIILFCKKLVLIHPFSDCNGRLFCNLILNRELIRNGFSPTLLDNPNRIDGYSLNESIFELIRGMDSFQFLKKEGLFKDTIRTSKLMQTESYPIQDIWNLFEQSKNKTDGVSGRLDRYGIFVVPKEDTTVIETDSFNHSLS
ncbi:hypothetical protein [Legionella antarctica]|nr:hypothetical protein [Legionella antarctica]